MLLLLVAVAGRLLRVVNGCRVLAGREEGCVFFFVLTDSRCSSLDRLQVGEVCVYAADSSGGVVVGTTTGGWWRRAVEVVCGGTNDRIPEMGATISVSYIFLKLEFRFKLSF